MTGGGPYRLDDQVGYILRLVSQRHASLFLSRLGSDLTPTQFAALVRLAELGQCSQNELGRQTAMDVATIKGVVDRLRGKGMVSMKDANVHGDHYATIEIAVPRSLNRTARQKLMEYKEAC